MLDEHCHIVWGVDDGAHDLEESKRMLRAAREVGIDRIVATPHMRWDDFDQAKVEKHFAIVRDAAAQMGLRMLLGYEVFYKRLLAIGLDQAPRFAVQGTRRLLLEFDSGAEVPPDCERVFQELQGVWGMDLTIAHPERYSTVWEDFDTVYRLKEMGCRVQVSAGDLRGGHFDPVAKAAKRILSEGLADALVSDAHCVEHYEDYIWARCKYF